MAFATSQSIDQLLTRGLAFRLPNNAPISSLYTLYANGAGMTYWSNSMNPRDLSTLSTTIGEVGETVEFQQGEINDLYGQVSTLSTALSTTSNALIDYFNSTITGISTFSTFYADLAALSNVTQAGLSTLSTTIGVGDARTTTFLTSTLMSSMTGMTLSTSTGLYNYTNRISSATVFYPAFYSSVASLANITLSTSTGLNNRITATNLSLSTNISSLRWQTFSSITNLNSSIIGYGPRISALEVASTSMSSITSVWISSQIVVSQSTQNAGLNQRFSLLSSYVSTIAVFATAQFGELSTLSTALYNTIVANNSTNDTQNSQISTLARNLSILTTSSILAGIYDTFIELEAYTVGLINSTVDSMYYWQSSLYYSTILQNEALSDAYFSTFTGTAYQSTVSATTGLLTEFASTYTSSAVGLLVSSSAQFINDTNSTTIGILYSTGYEYLISSLEITPLNSTVVYIGSNAGSTLQGAYGVAIGYNAGMSNQQGSAVAIGQSAGTESQGIVAVAVGAEAGQITQGASAVAIGYSAGYSNQGVLTIAIGDYAGRLAQEGGAVAIGSSAGKSSQLSNSVAIGANAGESNLGSNAIAIGAFAGRENQHSNSIVINAQGTALNTDGSDRFFVAPIRSDPAITASFLHYNTVTKEIVYNDEGGSATVSTFVQPVYLSSITTLGGNFYIDTVKFVSTGAAFYGTLAQRAYTGTVSAIDCSDFGDKVVLSEFNGALQLSTDYGSNFSPILTNSGAGYTCCAISSDGNYITAVYVNTGDYIHVSSDGGANFADKYNNFNNFIRNAMSSSGEYQVAITTTGLVVQSTDFGANWSAGITLTLTGVPSGLAITDDGATILVTDNTTIHYTTDGGSSWNTNAYTTTGIEALAMTGDGAKILLSRSDGADISRDGGATFTSNALNVPGSSNYYCALSRFTGKYMAVADYANTVVYTTTDFGSNWTNAFAGSNAVGAQAMSYDGEVGYLAAYGSGALNFTSNAASVNSNFLTTASATTFNDNLVALACSSNGQYVFATAASGDWYNSADYGANFASSNSYATNDCAMSATGQWIVLARQGNSSVWVNNNYGDVSSWTTNASPPANEYRYVAMSASGQYQIAIDSFGDIRKSTDYGSNWPTTYGFLSPMMPFGIQISDDGQTVLVISSTDVWKSTDGGFSFTSIHTTTNINNIAINGDASVILVAKVGGVDVSIDNGVTFSPFITGVGDFYWISLDRPTGRYMIATDSTNDVVYKSINFGQTWSAAFSGSNTLNQNVVDYNGVVAYLGYAPGSGPLLISSNAPPASGFVPVASRIGINTSTPGALLDIAGSLAFSTINVSSLKVELTNPDGVIAIGAAAGISQSTLAIAIGNSAGAAQGGGAVAIGYYAGGGTQGFHAVALGLAAGSLTQGIDSVAIGTGAGATSGSNAIAIGRSAGATQGSNAVAIGYSAGFGSQSREAIAIGSYAGFDNQSVFAIAIGCNAGATTQRIGAIAIGLNAGGSNQGSNAISLGEDAGRSNQGQQSISIGYNAGNSNQGSNSVAIGSYAGRSNQLASAVAIGENAGFSNQAGLTVAIGTNAGLFGQETYGVALGSGAGSISQRLGALAVGTSAGYSNQGSNSVAFGPNAGVYNQGNNSIAIGNRAGETSQGSNAIAIGFGAGSNAQVANSIVLNASNVALNAATNAGFYVNPVRSNAAILGNLFHYDTGAKELVYNDSVSVARAATSAVTASTIGVNTSNPVYRLDVAGGTIRACNAITTSSCLVLGAGYNGPYPLAGGAPAIRFDYATTNGGYPHYIISRHDAAPNSSSNALDFWLHNISGAYGIVATSANKLAMSVTAVGVGVGTSNPQYTLDVAGIARASTLVAGIGGSGVMKMRGDLVSTDRYQIEYNNASAPSNNLDIRFVGESDALTTRSFDFGYYTSNMACNAWNSKLKINSFTGAVNVTGSARVSSLQVNKTVTASDDPQVLITGDSPDTWTSTPSSNSWGQIALNAATTVFNEPIGLRIRADHQNGWRGSISLQTIHRNLNSFSTPILLQPRGGSVSIGSNAGTSNERPRSRLQIITDSENVRALDLLGKNSSGCNAVYYSHLLQPTSGGGPVASTLTMYSYDGGYGNPRLLYSVTPFGNFGIGNVSASEKLRVTGNAVIENGNNGVARLFLGPSPGSNNYDYCSLIESSNTFSSDYGSDLRFYTHGTAGNAGLPTERMRITNTGIIGINCNAPTVMLDVNGRANITANVTTTTLFLNNPSLTGPTVTGGNAYNSILGLGGVTTTNGSNRSWDIGIETTNNTGRALGFCSYDTTTFSGTRTIRGYINASVTNVQMNFTGQHRCFPADNSLFPLTSNIGKILIANGQFQSMPQDGALVRGISSITIAESLPLVSFSRRAKDKQCFGVICDVEDFNSREYNAGNFGTPYTKIEGDTRIFVNSIGEGAVWVCEANGPLENGDFITTSDIPGYGMKQGEEYIANYTVAKATMSCDFTPTMVPQQVPLMSTIEGVPTPVLDNYSTIVWTVSGEFEPAYKMRYITPDGGELTRAEYDAIIARGDVAYRAAFVGCTYHCG